MLSSPPWNQPSFTVGPLFPPPSPTLIPLSLALAYLDSLPPQDLVFWTDSSVPFSFDKIGPDVLANCSLYGNAATLSFSAGPVCSSLFAETCFILHALCWSWQHLQICRFSSLLLSNFRSVLATLPSLPSFVYLNLSG